MLAAACASVAAAQGPGRGGPPQPLVAEGHTVEPARLAETIPAQGSLLAAEQVEIVAELNRRIVKIEAAEGANVKRGDLLVKLDDRDLLAEIERLQVRRRLAQSNEERFRELLNSSAASQAQYDEALNAVQLLDAEERIFRVELEKTEIRAPFDGVLGRRYVSEGALVSSNTVLTELFAIDEIEVQFTVPERYGPALRQGMEFSFVPPGSDHAETGKITLIEPKIDENTRSVIAIGLVDNRDRELRPGAFVTVDLQIDEIAGGLMVPSQSIVPTLRGHSVFVVKDGKARQQDVKLGIRTPTQVQILEGLAAGDVVLTTNLLRVRPGSEVTIKGAEPAAPPAAQGG